MKNINKLSLVIFDMDGLMFDTERIAADSWVKAGKTFGFDITEPIVISTSGLGYKGTERVFKEHFGEEFPFSSVRNLRLKYGHEYIEKNGLPVKQGLYELLEFLSQKNILKAVASSTERERVEKYLSSAQILDKFDLIICGDEVSNCKPDPEIFLAAAKKLNCISDECIVLEDSEPGIMAASRAGMIPIVVPDLKIPSQEIEGLAHKKCDSLFEVKEYLKSIY